MKIWIKYALGVVLGAAFAFALPQEWLASSDIPQFICELCLRIGRYSLYPTLFFGFTMAVYELREERRLFRVGFKSAAAIIFITLAAAIVALISVSVFSPDRIPVFVEGGGDVEPVDLRTFFLGIFPSSAFEAFIDGAFILPLCAAAGFAGAAFASEKNAAKPALLLFDSLAHVCRSITAFFVDFVSVALIGLSFYWMLDMRAMLATGIFSNLLLLLLIDAAILVLALYPLAYGLFFKARNPYVILYASLAPAIAAFFSGDSNLTLPALLRHIDESLGVRRRVAYITAPMFSIFCRAGSVLTSIVGFIVVLKSYTILDVSFIDCLRIAGIAVFLSFFLGRFSRGGSFILLAAVCGLYGRGYESGYLILKPFMFFIGSVSAFIDAVAAVFGTAFVAQSEDAARKKEIRFFI